MLVNGTEQEGWQQYNVQICRADFDRADLRLKYPAYYQAHSAAAGRRHAHVVCPELQALTHWRADKRLTWGLYHKAGCLT